MPAGSPEDVVLTTLYSLALVIPSLVTNLLLVDTWVNYGCYLAGELVLGGLWYSLKLWLSLEAVHPSMPDFYTCSFLASTFWVGILSAFVFAIFEKVFKERFVINMTNQ
jgi:hypothetical protein